MPSLFGKDRWLSAYSLSRDRRVLTIDNDESTRLEPVPQNLPAPTRLTAVIIVENAEEALHGMTTVASAPYPPKVVVVCLDPENMKEITWFPSRYSHVLPQVDIFTPKESLSIRDGMRAGLQSVRTPYFFVLGAYGMMHADAGSYITLKLTGNLVDILSVKRFGINKFGWAHYMPDKWKPVWRTNYLIHKGGFRDGGDIAEIEQTTFDEIKDEAKCVTSNMVLFYT